MNHKALYAAFDLFPSSKGASTHIAQMAGFMFDYFKGGLLFTLGNKLYPEHETEESIEIIRFNQEIPHYLDRAHAYAQSLEQTITRNKQLETVHFRDVWSGLGIFQSAHKYKTVFEVNSLPSIELPYKYPHLKPATLQKIVTLENLCLQKSSHIVTPSGIISQKLRQRHVPESKISMVPNAAEVSPEYAAVPNLPKNYIVYFGAVQPWQGIDTLIKTFAGLKDIEGLQLVICSSSRQKQTKFYRKMAEKLGISENIHWFYQLEKPALNTIVKNALLSIAPLRECSRNIEQGCSPLKIFESMACGTPVVASDLPVTREIITHNVNGKLVHPDRPQELGRAIRILLEYKEQRERLGQNGKTTIATHYNWGNMRKKMFTIYQHLQPDRVAKV